MKNRRTPLCKLAAAVLLLGAAHPLRTPAATWTNADDRNPRDEHGVITDALWSYGFVSPDPAHGEPGHPGNWSGSGSPGTAGVTSAYLAAPGNTDCDVVTVIDSLTITSQGALNLRAGSHLTVNTTDIQFDGTMTQGGGGGQSGAFTNVGTFLKSDGPGTYELVSDIYFNSLPGSVIVVDSGNLQLPGHDGLFDTVKFDPAVGSVIDLISHPNTTDAFSGLFQGTLTNGTRAGTVRLSGGVMNDTVRAGLDNPKSCTLAFTGNVFQWTGGTIGGYQHQGVFTNTGVVNLAGADTKISVAAFTNKKTIIQTGTGNLNIGDSSSGGSFTNAAGAVYDLQSDAGMGGSVLPFNNVGLFKKSGGTGTSTLGVQFNNQGGTVQVNSGVLQLSDDSSATSTGGVFNVTKAGAVFGLGGGVNMVGTYTGSGPGVVRFSHGTIYGTNQAPGTTFNFTGGGFDWEGGEFGGYQKGHLLTLAGKITMGGPDGKVTYALTTNTGTITHTGTGNFAISLNSGTGSFDNTASGIYDLQTDAGIYGLRVFTNEGSLEKTAGTGTSTIESDQFTNTGRVVVRTGTLTFPNLSASSALNTTGVWQVFAGAGLTFADNTSVTVNKGDVTLSGANSNFPAINSLADNQGRFSLQGIREFTTAGALSSRGQLDLGAGSTLHVSGALTLADTSSTTFRIGGSNHAGAHGAGVLQVNGTAALAGNLLLQLTPDVVLPGATATITILTATSPLTGSFANAADNAVVSAGGGVSFRVHYGPASPYGANSVVLNHISVPAPTISSFTPTRGDAGATVVITGTNFFAPLTVAFTGKAATVVSFTSTKITTTVPGGASNGPIKVTTNGGNVTSSSSFTVTGVMAPAITSPNTATAQVGKPFSYQITASNNPTSFGVLGLPPGLTVNATTGLISGKPTAAGQKMLTLKASNNGGTGEETLTLTITQDIPAVTSAKMAAATVGKPFSYQITATNDPTNYSVLGLPPGLKVDGKTGLISGTPTTAGTKSLTLKATNAAGTGQGMLMLTIKSS